MWRDYRSFYRQRAVSRGTVLGECIVITAVTDLLQPLFLWKIVRKSDILSQVRESCKMVEV